MDPLGIIYEYYRPGARLTQILVDHSRRVAEKALETASRVAHLNPDGAFIYEAAILHDIGIMHTKAPMIHCNGTEPYVRHGVLGRRQLEAHGLHAHALVCERHVGTGITVADIQNQNLPLPLRDMQPVTIEEAIICYADKFFSKTNSDGEEDLKTVLSKLVRYGPEKADAFLKWHRLFNDEKD
jgi:uncharacterized protein